MLCLADAIATESPSERATTAIDANHGWVREAVNEAVTRPVATIRTSTDRSVVWFVAGAYAFSWGWLMPLALTGRIVTAGVGWPSHFPALLGPLLAAFVLTASQLGRPGVRDLFHRMVLVDAPWRWWAFAASPLMLLLVVLLADKASGHAPPAAEGFAVFSGLPSGLGVLGVAGLILVMAFGEETGWRGYALPRLQRRHSPLVATLILAAIWVVWHAPMFLVVDTYRSFDVAILLGWIMGLFCGAVVLSWLYNRSGGSILLVAFWHASFNIISGTGAGTGLLAGTSTTLVIALATTLVGLEIRAGRKGLPSVLAPSSVPLR
jgi:membrane protease YdiL (CAAX protease family)